MIIKASYYSTEYEFKTVCGSENRLSSISKTKKNTALKIVDFQRCMAPSARFERAAFRLGAQDVTSYTVIARDFQCRKTLENTGFFSDWPVIRYRLVMPDSC